MDKHLSTRGGIFIFSIAGKRMESVLSSSRMLLHDVVIVRRGDIRRPFVLFTYRSILIYAGLLRVHNLATRHWLVENISCFPLIAEHM